MGGGGSNLNKGKLGGWVEIAPQRGRSWPGAQDTRDRGQEPPAQGAAGPLPAAAHRLSGHAPGVSPPHGARLQPFLPHTRKHEDEWHCRRGDLESALIHENTCTRLCTRCLPADGAPSIPVLCEAPAGESGAAPWPRFYVTALLSAPAPPELHLCRNPIPPRDHLKTGASGEYVDGTGSSGGALL